MKQQTPEPVTAADTDEVVELGDVVELTLGSKNKSGREDKRYFYK